MNVLETAESYVGKEALVHLIQADGSLKEVHVLVGTASEAGLIIKEVTKRDWQMVYLEQIEEIGEPPVVVKKIHRRPQPPVDLSTVRQHLADRHGVPFQFAQESTPEEAMSFHEGLNHDILGHYHRTPEQEAKIRAKRAAKKEKEE